MQLRNLAVCLGRGAAVIARAGQRGSRRERVGLDPVAVWSEGVAGQWHPAAWHGTGPQRGPSDVGAGYPAARGVAQSVRVDR